MDFNKARTFVEVVDSGSVTHAANRLLRTQQAISLQIQQLEEELRCNLFDRNGPKISLTTDGKKLYEAFRPKLLAMENAVHNLKSEKNKVSGLIRIGVWMEQAVGYLPEMIRAFKESFPLVEFSLYIGEDHDIEKMLEANLLDIGLLLSCQNNRVFYVEPVFLQPLVPVASKSFISTYSQAKTIQDTFDLPLVDYAREYSAFNSWVKKNDKSRLTIARKKAPLITISNNVVLKQMVLKGLGFGFLLLDSIRLELDAGLLLPLIKHSRLKNISVGIDMVYKRKESLGYIHHAFIDYLRENKDKWCINN